MPMKFIFVLFSLFLAPLVQAQFVLSPTVESAQKSVMELRLNNASKLLAEEKRANPKNGFIPYLKCNILFSKLFITGDEVLFDAKIDSLNYFLTLVENNKANNSPYYNYCLAEMNFEIGALHMQFGNRWKSAWVIKDAFDYIKKNQAVADTFLPQQMLNGTLNVIMGSLPNRYKAIISLLGYSGEIEPGLRQLKKATQTEGTSYHSFKQKFTFAYCYALSSVRDESEINLWDVDPMFRESPILVFLQATFYRSRGQNDALIALLKKRESKASFPLYYLDFMLGKAKLNRLDPDADANFLIFLQNYKGQNSIKAAHRYLSWHYFIRGSVNQSNSHRQKTIALGTDVSGADKQAIIDVNKKYNMALIKSQLFFDGGYYTIALAELTKNAESFTSEKERIEFQYRLGRIYQRMKQESLAIQAYKKVFTFPQSSNTYEAANAALQLALIYESLANKKEAKFYFNKVLSYAGFPFEDGIHQKAKAGIARC